MPMSQRVQFSDAIEPLVRFIEDTPPAEILDRALDKLRSGVPTQTMLTASALAVIRSTEMPPGHHGGPLHPLAGLYAISKTVERLEGEQRFVPVLLSRVTGGICLSRNSRSCFRAEMVLDGGGLLPA